MRFSVLLLTALPVLAAAGAIKAPKRSSGFRQLVLAVERDGERGVIEGVQAQYLGLPESTPCRVMNWPITDDQILRSVYAADDFVLFATRHASSDTEEKRFFRFTRQGALEQIVVWRDQFDPEGRLRLNGRTVVNVKAEGRRAKAWLLEEKRFYFGRVE